MGGQKCPNCVRGHLLRTSRGTRRCRFCGFTKHDSFNRKSWDPTMFPKEPQEEKEKIPIFISKEEEKKRKRVIPKGEGFHTQEYQDRKFIYDEQLKIARKRESIEKILKKLRRNKYNPIKIIEIEGEIWDVKSGKLLRETEEIKKTKREELEPDRIIEEMVKKKHG